MGLRKQVVGALRGKPLPYSKNFGTFHDFPDDPRLLVKAFWSEYEARKEYDNLRALSSLQDPRLRVPRAEGIVSISAPEWFLRKIPGERGLRIRAAVVMERIDGTPYSRLPESRRYEYRGNIADLMDAFWEHRLGRFDGPKPSEVLCLADGSVATVDTHSITIGRGTPHFSRRFLDIYREERPGNAEQLAFFSKASDEAAGNRRTDSNLPNLERSRP